MNYKIYNNSNMKYTFGDELQSLLGFAQERFGFKRPPSIHFNSDADNASKHLGKTAYYDPESAEIHIYVDGRHAKDIMRSIAHELVHHVQNEQGSLATNGYAGEGYAQKNPQLRKMEREAYEKGNMCFRDWEDSYKSTNYSQRSDDMSLNEWKNKELGGLLTSRWGFKMDLGKLKENKEITHMCALHVEHKKTGLGGHPIAHTLSESGDISHYTVEFDSVIVENIPVENLNILQQEEHSHKRDDMKDHDEEKKVVSEEELEEMHCPPDPCGCPDMQDDPMDAMPVAYLAEEEGSKPDYIDLDGDGNKEESMKDAAEDAEGKKSKLEEKIFRAIMEAIKKGN